MIRLATSSYIAECSHRQNLKGQFSRSRCVTNAHVRLVRVKVSARQQQRLLRQINLKASVFSEQNYTFGVGNPHESCLSRGRMQDCSALISRCGCSAAQHSSDYA